MSDGSLSFLQSWEGFLPPNAVLMTKRSIRSAAVSPRDSFTSSVPAMPGVRFGFEAPDLADPAAREMLDKILAALEIPAAEVAVFATRPPDLASAVLVRFTLAAGDARAGEWEGACLTTYSLKAMLANPGLKKTAWAQLKDAVVRGRRESQ